MSLMTVNRTTLNIFGGSRSSGGAGNSGNPTGLFSDVVGLQIFFYRFFGSTTGL